MVTRTEQHVGEAEDRLLGTGEGQDVVGFDRLVQRRDLAPQQRMAGRFGVAELEPVPQPAGLVVGQREEIRHRIGLDVRGAQQVLDGELPAGEIALEGEVGDAHGPMMRHHGRAWLHRSPSSASPPRWAVTCRGWSSRRPGCGRSGLVDMLRAAPGLAGVEVRDAGDLAIEPGFRPDPDPRAKNRAEICAFLPRERDLVAAAIGGADGAQTRLMILGGDCTAHAGAMAGLRAARPDARYAIAWFDAHGDFNTPDTTPSGNVWGMPFAMLCGRGDPDLVAAADGPTVMEQDAALFGGQVLDETESRMLASSRVAQFGAGMLGTHSGLAAVEGWARSVATRVDGIYIAFDMDCLDGAEGWAVTMPEPDGLALETAEAAIRVLAAAMPVVGFGATAVTLANGDGPKTAAAAARLAEAAFAPA